MPIEVNFEVKNNELCKNDYFNDQLELDNERRPTLV